MISNLQNAQIERKKQMEENRKPREVAKCQTATEKVANSKSLMKGLVQLNDIRVV